MAFRLKLKKTPPQQISQIIAKLKSLNLLNDTEFVSWWQNQRDKHRPKSFRFLKFELYKKQVSQDVINQVLDTSFSKEIKRIKLALFKKFKLKKLPQQQKKRLKVLRFLKSRGFSWEHIKQAIT